VVARLLELNAERAKEEARSGATVTKKRGQKRAPKRASNPSQDQDLLS
jgi:hypothetical protein